MAFAILVGAGVFEVVKRATDPVLPLPDGEDIVGLTWDRGGASELELLRLSRRGTHHIWSIGAGPGGAKPRRGEAGAEPCGRQISPAAFRRRRVPPLLGHLGGSDDESGSPRSWSWDIACGKRVLAVTGAVVGRTVRLGDIRGNGRRRDAGGLRVSRRRQPLDAAPFGRAGSGTRPRRASRCLAASRRVRPFGKHRRRRRWSRREQRQASRIAMRN